MEKLIIKDIVFTAHCGVTEEERREGQRISVDIELYADLQEACSTDELARTIDYVKVGQKVVEVGQGREYFLIETMANEICREILKSFPVSEAIIRLRKYPRSLKWLQGYFEVEMKRKR